MFRILFLLVLFSVVSCELPPQCSNGLRDGDESDVDCGGSCSLHCADGLRCGSKLDCETGACSFGVCQAASCTDGIHNGAETDLDCGGGCMQRCDQGFLCMVNSDCESDSCDVGLCTATPGLSVKRGSVAGGTQVTITIDANNITPVKTVRFGEVEATTLTSSATIPQVLTVTTPPSPFTRPGEVPVSIEFEDGRIQTLKDRFRYYLTKLVFENAPVLEAEAGLCREVALGDINNDSKLDFIASCLDSNGYIYFGNGDGTFAKKQIPLFAGSQVLLGDIDKDGLLDIVAINQVVDLKVSFQQKDGSFQPAALPIGKKIYRARIADINKDGLLDFVLLHNSSAGEITLVTNRGGRALDSFAVSTFRASAYYSYDAALTSFSGGDSVDIALPSRGIDTTVVLLRNNGAGNFPQSAKFQAIGHNSALAAVDIDQDGLMDIIGSGYGAAGYVRGIGNSQFSPWAAFAMGKVVNYTFWDMSTGDLNADGFGDVILSHGDLKASDEIAIFLSKKVTSAIELTVRYETTCGDGGTVVGDFNNDGKADLVVGCNAAGGPPAQVLLNTSTE